MDAKRVIMPLQAKLDEVKADGLDVMLCSTEIIENVISLLKEQAKTKVVFGRTKDGEFVTECGNCGKHLDKAYSNCPKCKKELDWNSNQT